MKNLKNKYSGMLRISSAVALGLALSQSVPMQVRADEPRVSIGASGDAGLYGTKEDGNPNLSSNNLQVDVEAKIMDAIKAQLSLDLAEGYGRNLLKDGEKVTEDFDLEKFIETAQITIDFNKLTGMPVVTAIGKMDVPLGLDEATAPSTLDELRDVRTYRQAMAVRVAASPKLLSLLADQVEVFVAEGPEGQYDLEISSDELSYGVRITKEIVSGLSATGSYAEFERADTDKELRANFGLAYTDASGKWHAYGALTYMKNNPAFADSKYIVEGGVSRQLGIGRAGMSAHHIDDLKTRASVHYAIPIGQSQNVSIVPTVGYDWYKKGKGENGVHGGVEVRVAWGDTRAKELNPDVQARLNKRRAQLGMAPRATGLAEK